MAQSGSERSSPPATNPQTEADECAELQQRLDARRAECAQLKEALAQVNNNKAVAQEACLFGIRAAKSQMGQLRLELLAVKKWRSSNNEVGGEPLAPGAADAEAAKALEASEDEDVELKQRAKEMQQQVRAIRHELARWKHQVDSIEAKRPKQEEEIVRLKGELTHTLDVLTSTQHAVKHHEVEREFNLAQEQQKENECKDLGDVPLHGGGHGCVEAQAERLVREGIEDKNIRLSGKAKRLSGVVAAQQLLIQRLEKQVLMEERDVEQKDEQLNFHASKISHLKTQVRKHSNAHVAKMMGVAAEQPNRKAPATYSNSTSLELGQSASAPRLPPI